LVDLKVIRIIYQQYLAHKHMAHNGQCNTYITCIIRYEILLPNSTASLHITRLVDANSDTTCSSESSSAMNSKLCSYAFKRMVCADESN
jgi:hypothetical protein